MSGKQGHGAWLQLAVAAVAAGWDLRQGAPAAAGVR